MQRTPAPALVLLTLGEKGQHLPTPDTTGKGLAIAYDWQQHWYCLHRMLIQTFGETSE